MTQSLSFANRYVQFGLVALVLLFIVLMALAPAAGKRTSGSTYNRAPEGYLGWYRYMAAQGTPVQRWQRPLSDLLAQPKSEPQTLLRIYPGLTSAGYFLGQAMVSEWLAAGNNVVLLGVPQPVTEAPFVTEQQSEQGKVVIKTRRRHDLVVSNRELLGDKFGAIAWEQVGVNQTEGKLFLVITPHLAANAYLDEPGNYGFLTELVTQNPGPIWVDEYLHGYKDPAVIVQEEVNSWADYLANTPVKTAVFQSLILLGIFLLAQNGRLGNLSPLKNPPMDNSLAYIEALAAVLHKAASTPFLVDTITRAERAALQKSLGLPEAPVEDAVLVAAWQQQTGQPAQALEPLLQPPRTVTQQPDRTLKHWLSQIRQIRQTVIR